MYAWMPRRDNLGLVRMRRQTCVPSSNSRSGSGRAEVVSVAEAPRAATLLVDAFAVARAVFLRLPCTTPLQPCTSPPIRLHRWVKPSALATMSRSSSRPPAMRACSTSCARRSYRRRAATERQQTTCAKRSSSYASLSFRRHGNSPPSLSLPLSGSSHLQRQTSRYPYRIP